MFTLFPTNVHCPPNEDEYVHANKKPLINGYYLLSLLFL